MSAPDVSVVIPAYNAAAVIGGQLDALRAQRTDLRWEVVVADNRSTDDLRSVVAHHPIGRVVPTRVVDANSRQGVCAARNGGTLAARGRVVLYCDADDVVDPGWVQAGAEALQTYDLVGGRNRLLADPADPDSRVLNPAGLLVGATGQAVLGCNFGVRRAVFDAVGGFDEGLPPYGMDDVDFSRRVIEHGGRIGFEPNMVVHFRQSSGWRTLVRKTYLSGLAEFVVWHRYPEIFAARSAPRALALDLATFAPSYAGRALRREPLAGRSVLRDGLTRVAHLHGHLRWIRTGTLPGPVLLPAEPVEPAGDRVADRLPGEAGGAGDAAGDQF